jgi:hypothetical protein
VHLTIEEFIDAAEGARSEGSLPHLSACAACREQLAATRAAMRNAADADVPEPSPLFLNGLSARVNQAIDADLAARRRWWMAWAHPRVLVPLSAVALLAIVVATVPNRSAFWRGTTPVTTSAPAETMAPAPTIEPANDVVDLSSDPLLTLVSDLSANMDWDTAAAAGLAERGSADHVVTHMNSDELRALKKLLQAEMARSGA